MGETREKQNFQGRNKKHQSDKINHYFKNCLHLDFGESIFPFLLGGIIKMIIYSLSQSYLTAEKNNKNILFFLTLCGGGRRQSG